MSLQKSGWNKVLENLATASPGTRAWPNRTKDRDISFRIDYGPHYTGQDGRLYRNLVLQPNKNTKDPRVAAAASADSHQKLATVPIPIDNPPSANEFAAALTNQLG